MPRGLGQHARLLCWGLEPAKSAVIDTRAWGGKEGEEGGRLKGGRDLGEPGNKDIRWGGAPCEATPGCTGGKVIFWGGWETPLFQLSLESPSAHMFVLRPDWEAGFPVTANKP